MVKRASQMLGDCALVLGSMHFLFLRALVMSCILLVGVRLAAADVPMEELYEVSLDASRKITRSGVIGERLAWVVVQNGTIVLERNAENELSYTYYDNRVGNEYFVYLHKWGGTHYVRVSNIVGYRFGLESNAPIITSARSMVAIVNQPFRYQIEATGGANQFSAANLPAGLTLDEDGVISGTPTATGHHEVALTAAAGYDAGTAGLTLSVVSGINDGGFTDRHTLVLDSLHTVTWNENPASTHLNMVVKANGVVVLQRNVLGSTSDRYYMNTSGRVYSIHLESLINGAYRRVSNVVYYQPGVSAGFPLITSPPSAFGTVGVVFAGYQAVAQNGPASFSATGLPGGLSISTTGLISGTPTESGTFPVSLRATNGVGSHTLPMTVTIQPNAGTGLLFTLTMAEDGTVWRSSGDLAGLTWVVREGGVDMLRRVASGEDALLYHRAKVAPGYTVHLEAWLNGAYRRVSNIVGTTAVVPLAFLGESRITLRAGEVASPYTITLNAAYQSLTVGTLPAGLQREGATIFGTPTTPGIYAVGLSATSATGNATRTLTIEVLPAPVEARTYTLTVDSTLRLTRTPGEMDSLTWVIVRNGLVVLKRFASDETNYTYYNNGSGGEFAVYLEGRVDGRHVRVSNVVGYTRPASGGAPVFATPRRLLFQVGREVSLELLASGAPTLYQASALPAGLELLADGTLNGTPTSAGTYEVTFSATRGGLTRETTFALEVLPASETSDYTNRYQVSVGADHAVVRTPGEDPELTWVAYRDGVISTYRTAENELNNRDPRNLMVGAYTVHLEAFVDGARRVVSNTVAYTVKAEAEEERLSRIAGLLVPETEFVEMPGGGQGLSLRYSVDLEDTFSVWILEQSTNLRDWTEAKPLRRVLQSDETSELREDVVPLADGPPRFFRVTAKRPEY